MKNADSLYMMASKLYLEALKAEDFWGIAVAVSAIHKLKEEIKAAKLSVP